jgi:serine protease DegQ
MDALTSLNETLAAAVDRAAAAVVQVQGHRRPAAGVVFASELVLAPASALDSDTATVRVAGGATHDAAVLGRAFATGLAVARVPGLAIAPFDVAPEPAVGHLAVVVGRTWSGSVMATVTNVAVVGGPLRTGRSSQIDRVIRLAQPPHGALTGGALIDGAGRALGVVTGAAIRETTVVIPAAIAWAAGQQIVAKGGTKQGYLGISSSPVKLPAGQRGGREQAAGLLVSGLVEGSPAAAAGVLVGDVIVAFDGTVVEDPEALLTLLRGDRAGKAATLTVIRGGEVRELAVTVGERGRR